MNSAATAEAVAASTADVALLLVDAARGVTRQTYRHLTICALMGVHHVIIAVNKLDAVGFDHARFAELADAVAALALTLSDAERRALEAPYRPHPVVGF